MDLWRIIEVIGGILAVFIAYKQYAISRDQKKINERQDTYETISSQTRVLADNNNNILQSWTKTAEELRLELNQCRKTEQELRIRMSGLETKIALYRNVAYKGWPLSIVEEEAERREKADDREVEPPKEPEEGG